MPVPAIIHSGVHGLPHAVPYYRRFSREPSRDPNLDMTLGSISSFEEMNFELLLNQMAAATNTEKTILIVCHGTPTVVLMPVVGGTFQARFGGRDPAFLSKEVLEILLNVRQAMKEAAEIRTKPPGQQPALWTALLNRLAPGSVQGTISAQEGAQHFERFQTSEAGKLFIPRDRLENLVAAINRAYGRFERVEFRGCGIGRDVDATTQRRPLLDLLCRVLGAKKVLAPEPGTFYIAPFNIQMMPDLSSWDPDRRTIPRNGQLVRLGTFSPASQRGFDGKFGLKIYELSSYRYWAEGVALGPAAVESFGKKFISPAFTGAGPFPLAGFIDLSSSTLPFILPLEDDYRKKIALGTQP